MAIQQDKINPPNSSSPSKKGLGTIELRNHKSSLVHRPSPSFLSLTCPYCEQREVVQGTRDKTIQYPSICFLTRFYSSGQQQSQVKEEGGMRELEPLKLPGKLGTFTGNVMYPNEESAVWDVNGRLFSS